MSRLGRVLQLLTIQESCRWVSICRLSGAGMELLQPAKSGRSSILDQRSDPSLLCDIANVVFELFLQAVPLGRIWRDFE